MASGDIVILINEGDTEFRDGFNGREYRIPPGQKLMVEWDAMCLWLGHPDANDFDPRNRVRQVEYQRLRTRYGVDAYCLSRTMNGEHVDVDDVFQSMRPKLRAINNQDQVIITVADDPAGDSVVAPVTPGDQSTLILQRMAQMEAELQSLRAQAAQNERTRIAMADAAPIGTDNPDLTDGRVAVGAEGIVGMITETPSTEPAVAPRPPTRQGPSEDTPTRVRVTS